MLRKSVALAAGFTAVLSLLNLNTAGPITFGVTKAETDSDAFTLFGTLDAAATDATNAQNLGSFTGTTPADVLRGYAEQAATWPYVLVRRDGGSTAGTFYVTGDETAAATVASTAAPAAGAYSAVIDLTSYGAAGVRIGGSAAMTVDDVFLVYGTQDNTVTSSTGCKLIARITGGGGTNSISALVKGYPYAIVYRVSGSTAGNILAAGVKPPIVGSGSAWTQGGNAFGATGVLGTTDAQTMTVISHNTTFVQDDGTTMTLGRNSGATASVLRSGTGGVSITSTGAGNVSVDSGTTGAVNVGTGITGAGKTVSVGSLNGTSTLNLHAGSGGIALQALNGIVSIASGTGSIRIGIDAEHAIAIGNNVGSTAVIIDCGTGGVQVGATATDHQTILGTQTGTSQTVIRCGTAGLQVNPAATGGVTINTGTTGALNLDSGTTGAVNLGAGANAKTITIGNQTGATLVSILAGSGGVGINATPNASALLQLDSTTRGFAPPRMTTAERDAIADPLAGLIVYNSTTNKLNLRTAAAWEAITSA